jgi:HAD superfamily hydrolase (TIGR01509 family)
VYAADKGDLREGGFTLSSRAQLVLDLGGVLVTNLSPLFWQQLANHSKVLYEEMVSRYKQDVRESLWSGAITEDDFWNWLSGSFSTVDGKAARELLHANLTPLPALRELAQWSQAADIHLLSNHRTEWVAPILAEIQPYLKSVTISSSIGFRKPHPRIYDAVAQNLTANQMILFVDDQRKNLEQASRLGWKTMLADENGDWIAKVTNIINKC